MLRVKHLLARKGRDIWSVDSDEPVLEAIQIMADRHVGALPVLREGQLVGVISERDYARKVILLGRSSAETPVWQIMSAPVITVGPEDAVRGRAVSSPPRYAPVTQFLVLAVPRHPRPSNLPSRRVAEL